MATARAPEVPMSSPISDMSDNANAHPGAEEPRVEQRRWQICCHFAALHVSDKSLGNSGQPSFTGGFVTPAVSSHRQQDLLWPSRTSRNGRNAGCEFKEWTCGRQKR